MGKKVIYTGAPAYMAQYTALMTILLAFFMLLNTLSDEQEAGFKAGIGDVRNAFGLEGGLGLFSYTFWGKGGSNAPNEKDNEDGEQGIEKNLVEREGGSGNTSSQVDDAKFKGKYLRVKIPGRFQDKTTKMSPDMIAFIRNAGMGFELFDFKITTRCYADDYRGGSIPEANAEKNRKLALERAARIMRYLKSNAGISLARMEAIGYSSLNYFRSKDEYEADEAKLKEAARDGYEIGFYDVKDEDIEQEAYFYVFFRANTK